MEERTPKKLKILENEKEINKEKPDESKQQINENDILNFNGFDQLLTLIQNEESIEIDNKNNNKNENENENEDNDDEDESIKESEAILFSLKNNFVYKPVNIKSNEQQQQQQQQTKIQIQNKNDKNDNNNNNNNEKKNDNENDKENSNKNINDDCETSNKFIDKNYKLSTFLQKANDELEKNEALIHFEKRIIELESEIDVLKEKLESRDNEILDLNRMLSSRNKFLNSIPRELLLNWIVTNKIVLATSDTNNHFNKDNQ
ncbi:hypothetical protein ACTFIR_006642 [Dictyostelium discoideum]